MRSTREHRPNPSFKGDRLKQLRAFCQAARLGSISRAAEQVMSSQPAVSQQVRGLEEEIGETLFERRGPRIVLTRAGEHLYRRAMPLVEGMDRLPDTFAEQYRGAVEDVFTIGTGMLPAGHLLPEFLQRFRERHPDVRVNVRVGTGRERLDWLRTYEVDIILAAVDFPPDDVHHQLVHVSDPVLITPEDHPLAGRESVEVSDLAGFPMVGHTAGTYVQKLADVLIRLHGLRPMFMVEVDGWAAIKAYVESGLGISFVPDLCLTGSDRVWRIPIGHLAPPRKYGVLTRRDGLMSLAASEFLQLLTGVDSSGG